MQRAAWRNPDRARSRPPPRRRADHWPGGRAGISSTGRQTAGGWDRSGGGSEAASAGGRERAGRGRDRERSTALRRDPRRHEPAYGQPRQHGARPAWPRPLQRPARGRAPSGRAVRCEPRPSCEPRGCSRHQAAAAAPGVVAAAGVNHRVPVCGRPAGVQEQAREEALPCSATREREMAGGPRHVSPAWRPHRAAARGAERGGPCDRERRVPPGQAGAGQHHQGPHSEELVGE
mmetsp:Transcript_16661/g.39892  ORF Transcript_16661/g.39892 Transcript_16661/m.39892 type:complete len:233 (-) Transcript_16661:662-1360(-)